ncbi:MAG TPA: hypothetical protein EYN73_00175 [Chromatiaceae bacterium]|jgi:ABC-type phosphate transport system substrate-binding protein|nr:hypothetical protein [Chromatiaceae bacterium]HIB83712.1 hypothetical protein [Chromatiaceae bacterium]HIN83041.1 hypothetical protein [Chromatiales bacterium]HIO14181.1 hypothetical protein [Chromatiales bacterium]HIO55122.1 hypothetical protein [Chromatiales bacterium]
MIAGYLRVVIAGLALMQPISGLAGDETSADVAFSTPAETPDLRSADWVSQGIRHQDSRPDADLAVALDQQQYAMLTPLIQEFAREHNLKIAVTLGTCGISAGMLSKKQIDVGGFCCPPGSSDRLPELQFHTIGISSIALLTHPDNFTETVTLTEARRLFSGITADWSTLEPIRAEGPVVPVGRLHCKLRPGHWRLLLPDDDRFSPWLLEVGSIQDMIVQAGSSPESIGYETVFMANTFKGDRGIKMLAISGYRPDDLSALAAGRYPLYRTYNLTTWKGAASNPKAEELVVYLTQTIDEYAKEYSIVSAKRLRANKWKFVDDELIGAPR